MMFGASPIAVQRILRHSDIRTTTDVYSHLAPDYLRAEINKLSFRPKQAPDPHPSPLPRTGEGTGFTTPVLRSEKAGGSAVSPSVEFPNDSSIYCCRGDRIRTCDILLPKQTRYQAALRPEAGAAR
jgi:hypothetical protein